MIYFPLNLLEKCHYCCPQRDIYFSDIFTRRGQSSRSPRPYYRSKSLTLASNDLGILDLGDLNLWPLPVKISKVYMLKTIVMASLTLIICPVSGCFWFMTYFVLNLSQKCHYYCPQWDTYFSDIFTSRGQSSRSPSSYYRS